jgi:hypothetical protein
MHSQIQNMCTLFFTLPGTSNLLFKSLLYIQMRPYVVNKIVLNICQLIDKGMIEKLIFIFDPRKFLAKFSHLTHALILTQKIAM